MISKIKLIKKKLNDIKIFYMFNVRIIEINFKFLLIRSNLFF